ncbi:MAG: sigma-54 dependent transcriptional regulator [Pseudomonadales bacterium]|jgi:DNA-binding NtrC family response regulator|nr:sigma-54 dependent transcriptional regulator [Pseudomonadales bacterium]
MSHVLIIENEDAPEGALCALLERHGHEVTQVRTLSEARAEELASFSLILADLRLPGGLGTDLVADARGVPVVILSAHASLRAAIDAMKLGASEFIVRPFDQDELLLILERVRKEQRIVRQNAALKSELSRDYPVAGMIGSCGPMKLLFERIRKVAPTESTVLILGESGTGKELVARALHEQSPRSDAPMISLNCAAIPDTLIESELFGHEKGAFTGAGSARRGLVEAADGGTLFLDEIGELPLEAQARLLRVLQEGEIRRVGAVQTRKVDVRLIAATHRDLRQLAERGAFRDDLFYRLNVVTLKLPALRDRGDDIYELAERLLERACHRLHKSRLAFSEDALTAMRNYEWPGNVRELENAIERAVILSDGTEITPDLLAIDAGTLLDSGASTTPAASPTATVRTLAPRAAADDGGRAAEPPPAGAAQGENNASLEDYFVRFVLDHEDRMTETEIAQRLGISRKSLWERRQRLGIPRRRTRNRGLRGARDPGAAG